MKIRSLFPWLAAALPVGLALTLAGGGLAQQPQGQPQTQPQPQPQPQPAGQATPAVDPFQRNAAVEEEAPPEEFAPRSVLLRFEVFSIDRKEGNKLLRSPMKDSALYAELVARTAAKQAELDSLVSLRARSGEKALAEGILEYIYPTEYFPGNGLPIGEYDTRTLQNIQAMAQQRQNSGNGNATPLLPPIPATNPRAPAAPAGFFAPALPTSFETRNTGWTTEVEPTIGSGNRYIDLRVSHNHTELAGQTEAGQGVSQTKMPNFETQRVETAATLITGKPLMLGTHNRTPGSVFDTPGSAERLWFAFVTGDVVSP